MKKILFAFLFMITVSLSFCKKKECEVKSDTINQALTYTEKDTSSAYKGQQTLTFFNTCNCFSATGLDCINGAKGGCFDTSFGVLNLTNKNVIIQVFATEEDALLNQLQKTVLRCSPNSLLKTFDAGLGFIRNPCSSDLTKLVRVSYQ